MPVESVTPPYLLTKLLYHKFLYLSILTTYEKTGCHVKSNNQLNNYLCSLIQGSTASSADCNPSGFLPPA